MDLFNIQSINLSRLLREGGSAEAGGEIHGVIRAGEEEFHLDGPDLWKASVTAEKTSAASWSVNVCTTENLMTILSGRST